MNQQINLYQPMFRQQRIIFSARTTLALAVGFLVLLAIWWWLLDQRVDSLETQLEREKALEQRLSEQSTELSGKLGRQQPDPVIMDEVDRLRQRLNSLQSSRELVRQRIPAQPVTLSEQLSALARSHPVGLWLTGIEIRANGRDIGLRGRILDSPLLTEFLDQLGREPVFAGQLFRQLQLQQPDDDKPGLRFLISTLDPEPPE